MITVYVILWFLAGLSGCWLADSISLAHPEDKSFGKFQHPSDVFWGIAGLAMLLVWVLIAIEYALKRGGKE